MKLRYPLNITFPEKTLKDGTVVPQTTVAYLTSIPLTIIDNDTTKRVQVKLDNSQGNITIWEKSVYDLAGNYTTEQIEERLYEILGENENDASLKISKLFGYVAPLSAWSTYHARVSA